MNVPMRSYGLGVVHKNSSHKEPGDGCRGTRLQCGPFVFVYYLVFLTTYFYTMVDKTRVSSFRNIVNICDHFLIF